MRCYQWLTAIAALTVKRAVATAWARLNRLGTGVGRSRSCLHQWGMVPFCALQVWRRRTNRSPCCPSMSNPLTSQWTARPDGSRRWDNRTPAQHLLMRPSSGQQQRARKTKGLDWKNPPSIGKAKPDQVVFYSFFHTLEFVKPAEGKFTLLCSVASIETTCFSSGHCDVTYVIAS